jgi:hypothetical protein
VRTESKRLCRADDACIDGPLAATRHVPLIFMLIIAAVVHAIAVNDPPTTDVPGGKVRRW